MRPFLQDVIETLVGRHATTHRVDLNDIAEAIGDHVVSYEEVELLIDELENRGCIVSGPPTARELELLGSVLTAARELHRKLGRKPSVVEIATAIEQPEFVVRRALENAQRMGA